MRIARSSSRLPSRAARLAVSIRDLLNRARVALPVLLVLVAPAPARAGVTVALQPGAATVAPGAEFDLVLQVTQAGSAFNGFDAIVGYDPAALTLIRLPDAQQQGSLMTGACSDLFDRFATGVDRDTISEVLLCNQTFVTGPGQLYRLRFRASSTPQVTHVRFLPGLHFYNAGLYVTPVASSDAAVGIGVQLGVEEGRVGAGLRLRALPNPALSSTTVQVEVDIPGDQELLVSDVQGRVVRHLASGGGGPGSRRVVWDGRSDAQLRVPAGLYLITLRVGDRSARTRLLMLR